MVDVVQILNTPPEHRLVTNLPSVSDCQGISTVSHYAVSLNDSLPAFSFRVDPIDHSSPYGFADFVTFPFRIAL